MISTPVLTLHVLPPSQTCMTADAAPSRKGLEYERVELTAGPHNDEMERLYGEGHRTVPGLLVDGEPVHVAYVRSSWKYHRISGERLAEDLAGLPAKIDHVDHVVREGVIGGAPPTAADLQLGATPRVLLPVGDLRPLIEGRPAERVARDRFPDYRGDVPAGAYPAGRVPDSV